MQAALVFATMAVLAALVPSLSIVGATHALPCPDVDGNEILTVADVLIVSTYVGQTVPPAPVQADMDLDGDVDEEDVNYFLTLPPPLLPYTCQDAPIGPKGVGGVTELAAERGNSTSGARARWAVAAGAATVAFGVAGATLQAIRRRAG